MQSEAAVLGTFAVSVFLFLSNFHICGVVGNVVSQVMLGVFGCIGYVAPVLLFAGMVFYVSNQGNIRAVYKMLAVEVLLVALCGLAQLMFGGGFQEKQTLRDIYELAGVNGKGGGVIGGALVWLLHTAVGTIGAYLVLLVCVTISLVCITERSFVSVVKRGSGKAYRYAKEDYGRRKEIREERREEQRLMREEQRVKGVNLSSTDLSENGGLINSDAGIQEEKESSLQEAEPANRRADRKRAEKVSAPAAEERLAPPVEERTTADGSRGPEPAALCEELMNQPDPADVFKGKITMAGVQPEEDVVPFEEDVSLLRHRVDEDVFVSRDRQAFDEMSVFEEKPKAGDGFEAFAESEARAAYPAGPAFAESAPVPLPDILPAGSVNMGLKAEPKPYLSAAFEPGTGPAPYAGPRQMMPEQTMFGTLSGGSTASVTVSKEDEWPSAQFYGEPNDDTVIHVTEQDTEPYVENEEYWEPVQPIPSHRQNEKRAGAGETSVFHVPEGRKSVVTTSGKVIETDTEEVLQRKAGTRRQTAAEKAEADRAVLREVEKAEEKPKRPYVIPPLDLLTWSKDSASGQSEKEFKETAIKLQQTLRNFGVGVTVTNISCGPTVTRYELHPEQGVKVSRIQSLSDDIKLNLAATDIRIEAPIPGKAAVGIEVPNKVNSIVYLRELLESDAFKKHTSNLAFAVGKDIGGQVIVADLAKMPHLLIAGQTGSGKSVGINTMIMSLLYRTSPEDVKLIMIDPKVVELSIYNGIPHLLIPVVTDPKKAAGALNWAVAEMMERYNKFAQTNVRDLKGYNARVKTLEESGDIPKEEIPAKLPQLVIIIDELADLMMVASGEVEDAICRLAQLARAAGIHLVIATQRPSVNVITGVIKANVPSRIAFSVASGVDSRTILDMVGAEKLLGNGDMLFYPSGYPKPIRVQGAFVSDTEVSRVTEFIKEQNEETSYDRTVEAKMTQPMAGGAASGGSDRDALFVEAGRFIIEKDKASIGMLQRMFKVGFNRAARIMDQLAEAGVVGEEEGTKPRKILMSMEEFEELLEAGY
ncbi:MAG: DNA translocase FtsK [Lachnospiraceae bacterium]|nr:DNA translocase FtsK [Lachnospiraceae bacterium]